MKKTSKIFVAGASGMVGSAICRALNVAGYTNICSPRRNELDLVNGTSTDNFFSKEKPDHVFLSAAKVGGIQANDRYPADFIYENLMITSNVIHAAYTTGVKRLLFLGSSCIYPKHSSQPITENSLLSAALEPSNEPYAIAKIAGIKLCESYNRQHNTDFRSVMPTNVYGQGDNFHLENSHVVAALLHKFHIAQKNHREKIVLWGSGSVRREFIHVDDLADACLFIMNLPKKDLHAHIKPRVSHINVGSGTDLSIKELALIIKDIVGYKGTVVWDSNMLDGTPRKLLDVSVMEKLGWRARTDLREGLQKTYQWFLANWENIRK